MNQLQMSQFWPKPHQLNFIQTVDSPKRQ